MLTIKDIANLAGVAPSTVSAALNNTGRISKETREKVLKIVEEYDYQPNAIAKGLRSKGTNAVGLLIPSITNPFYPEMARGVEDVANNNEYSLFLGENDWSEKKERVYVKTLINKQVDGIIFAAPRLKKEELSEFANAGLNIVVLNESIEDQSVDEIWIDYISGAIAMTEHLIQLGHRRIGFVGGPPGLRRCQDRLYGFKQSLKRNGIPIDNNLITIGNFDFDSGYEQGINLLKNSGGLAAGGRPTAIFAANDLTALGVLAAAQDLGLKVPEDLSVAGYDNIEFCTYIRPKLTTVHQPNYEAGRLAMEMLLKRKNKGAQKAKSKVTLETTIVIRNSTAPPPDRED